MTTDAPRPLLATPAVPSVGVGRGIPSLTALRCLDASARLGSFTRAAQEVHLTQGAVSHQILKLEEDLGVPLFERKRSGLVLTPCGRAYWNDVLLALQQLERATQSIRMQGEQGGMLNLSTASSFGTYWLLPRLGGFLARHPEVTLNISMHIGEVDFSSMRHDAAVEFSPGATPELCAHKVADVVVHPYGAPLLLAEHAGQPLAQLLQSVPLIHQNTLMEAWPGWLEAAGLAQQVQLEHCARGSRYDLLSMALNGAIAGLGVALLPGYIADAALQTGQLQRLSEVSWTSSKAYYLRFPRWKSGQPALRKFCEWLDSIRPPMAIP